MEQEILTVKFGGQDHQVDLQTFAYSVLNFAAVIKEVNKNIAGKPISIDIKAPEKGSLIVHLIAKITENQTLIPETIDHMASIVEVVGGLYGFHKFISGRKIKTTEKNNGGVKISLEDGSSLTVAENVYNIYVNIPAVPNSISQTFSALNDDPAVSSFEVLNDGERLIDAVREDYSRLSIKQQFESDKSRILIESANIYISKLVFDKADRKWEFYFGGNKISAIIIDDDFYKAIDRGESFSKGDQLKVDLKITQILDESVGTYVNQSYQVVRVHEHIKRAEPLELPFNKKIEG